MPPGARPRSIASSRRFFSSSRRSTAFSIFSRSLPIWCEIFSAVPVRTGERVGSTDSTPGAIAASSAVIRESSSPRRWAGEQDRGRKLEDPEEGSGLRVIRELGGSEDLRGDRKEPRLKDRPQEGRGRRLVAVPLRELRE